MNVVKTIELRTPDQLSSAVQTRSIQWDYGYGGGGKYEQGEVRIYTLHRESRKIWTSYCFEFLSYFHYFMENVLDCVPFSTARY